MTEETRIQFIADRDGPKAALKFAEQTLYLYIKAAIDSSKYKDSIEYFEQYLKDKGYEVCFVKNIKRRKK